jgi:hypothetical protein
MNDASLGLTGFGFWLAIAFIVLAIVWLLVKKQQMKLELTLKLLEKGQNMDPELLAKLLAADSSRVPIQQKSAAEEHRAAGGFIGFIFLVAGLIFALVGMLRGPELHWPLIGLGAFSFVFGYLCWLGAMKEYQQEKAEEKLSRD